MSFHSCIQYISIESTHHTSTATIPQNMSLSNSWIFFLLSHWVHSVLLTCTEPMEVVSSTEAWAIYQWSYPQGKELSHPASCPYLLMHHDPTHARMETGLFLCGSCTGNCAAVSSWGQRPCHIQKTAYHGAPHHSPKYILFVPSSWASVVWWWRAWHRGTIQAWPLDSHLFPEPWPREPLHRPQPATKRRFPG